MADEEIPIRRTWAMPSRETFTIPPIRDLLDGILRDRVLIVDPFARNSKLAHLTNDLSFETSAQNHLEAEEFVATLERDGVHPDAVLWDPPYSLRQVEECYEASGWKIPFGRTQDAGFGVAKDRLAAILAPGAVVVSFGWNSAGFGKRRGLELSEILLVSHGGPHNDTIVTVERKEGRHDHPVEGMERVW